MRRLALLLGLALAVAARARAERQIEVEVAGVALDAESGVPVVQLVEKGGARALPIWIGPFEAQAIALELGGLRPPRPMTHDLMTRLLDVLGAKVDRVEIVGLEHHTYLALLRLTSATGEPLSVDARPSDAIALAVRLRRPIVVPTTVFPEAELLDGGRVARLFGLTVQDLTPELAEAVGMPDARGALVSAVDAGSPARRVRRGDVITGMDGRPVRSLQQLVAAIEDRAAAAPPPRLDVRRRDRSLTVRVRSPQP